MNPDQVRLLATLPDPGPCTVSRAAYRAGLSTDAAKRAAAELVRAELITALEGGRLTPSPRLDALLELTDAGRYLRAEAEQTG